MLSAVAVAREVATAPVAVVVTVRAVAEGLVMVLAMAPEGLDMGLEAVEASDLEGVPVRDLVLAEPPQLPLLQEGTRSLIVSEALRLARRVSCYRMAPLHRRRHRLVLSRVRIMPQGVVRRSRCIGQRSL